MNFLLRASLVLISAGGAVAFAAADNGPGVFSILPKSFQKNPRVDFNVITEMSAEGRKAPQPSPQSPIYYVSNPGTFVQRGHGAPAREKPPAVERMEAAMEAALAKRGFLRANNNQPASMVIVYTWGSHSAPSPDDPETATVSNHVLINEIIERARLVGGDKFANELVKAMEEEGAARQATPKPRVDPTGEIPAQPNVMGDFAASTPSTFSALERFRRKSDKNESMMDDAGNSIYFVVASAVTFSVTKPDTKVLLWRTKMTVNASGLSLTETLPALVAAAGPYLGREMSEPEIMHQRLGREGRVEAGTPTVVSDDEAAKPNASGRPAAPAKK